MRSDFGVIFWLHLFIILALFASPVLFPWTAVAFGMVLYYVQLAFVGDCILTKAQFTEHEPGFGFYEHYLLKLGIPVNRRKLAFIQDRVIPALLLCSAFALQRWMGFAPLI